MRYLISVLISIRNLPLNYILKYIFEWHNKSFLDIPIKLKNNTSVLSNLLIHTNQPRQIKREGLFKIYAKDFKCDLTQVGIRRAERVLCWNTTTKAHHWTGSFFQNYFQINIIILQTPKNDKIYNNLGAIFSCNRFSFFWIVWPFGLTGLWEKSIRL